jgi:hypothetical protein
MGKIIVGTRQRQEALLSMANFLSLAASAMILTLSMSTISTDGSIISGSMAAAALQPGFYDDSCPNLHSIVFESMRQAASQDLRAPASILRLFFHDCFVQVRAALQL